MNVEIGDVVVNRHSTDLCHVTSIGSNTVTIESANAPRPVPPQVCQPDDLVLLVPTKRVERLSAVLDRAGFPCVRLAPGLQQLEPGVFIQSGPQAFSVRWFDGFLHDLPESEHPAWLARVRAKHERMVDALTGAGYTVTVVDRDDPPGPLLSVAMPGASHG